MFPGEFPGLVPGGVPVEMTIVDSQHHCTILMSILGSCHSNLIGGSKIIFKQTFVNLIIISTKNSLLMICPGKMFVLCFFIGHLSTAEWNDEMEYFFLNTMY